MPDSEAIPGQTETVCPFFVVLPVQELTARQRQVLRLAALGCADQEMARRLALSVYTVRDHLRAVRERLGAWNTAHAVAIALVCGLIELSVSEVIEGCPGDARGDRWDAGSRDSGEIRGTRGNS
jgi:DNA-binding CsgD family transcriptional regulator